MSRLQALRELVKARYQSWPRVIQLLGLGLVLGTVVIWAGGAAVSFRDYRRGVRESIESDRDRVAHLTAYVGRADGVEHERDLLAKRLESLQDRLVAGDTATLAAAHLQDHVTTVAKDTGVNVQSAQVMRDEDVGEYRRVTVRLTLTATIKTLGAFLEAVEYGTPQLSVPFLQVDRRGSKVRRRASLKRAEKIPERVLSATMEVRGLAARGAAPSEEATGKS